MRKTYKILLSAYACEPNKGSEPGVGWNWALEIAKRGHEVWVLTRKNNQSNIEEFFLNNVKPENIHFLYYDLPKYLSYWKQGSRGVHLYYFLWQIGIVSLAIREHKKINFDFIHHITFVTIHQPSFLFLVRGLPFFYGPSGGGDVVPKRFLSSFPWKRRVKEYLLITINSLLKVDLLRNWMFLNTDLIFCNSQKTKDHFPGFLKKKISVNLAIGVNLVEDLQITKFKNRKVKLLYVGNFLHWKGFHLVLKAYEKFINNDHFTLSLIGKGKFSLLSKYKSKVERFGWMPQSSLFEIFQTYDILIFPSFRDSGGMVVLEAMANGLPVICLDLGGPGIIVDDSCGHVIKTKNKTDSDLIQDISKFITKYYNNINLRTQLSKGALARAKDFTWAKTVDQVYIKIETFIHEKNKSVKFS
ncbi:MAG: glycosyltransferase family 4 protein [Bacteroidota bacterium]